jgi:RHS repeat-associated protein/uncharacterized delta-60 repeat protein
MDLYYSANWQVLEERNASTGVVKAQNVWSPVYIDALVERDLPDAAVTAGALDTSFNSTGKWTLDTTALDQLTFVEQSDGKLVGVGVAGSQSVIARLNPDGTLDNTFDGPSGTSNGWFTFSLSGGTLANAVAVQADGKIVVAGRKGTAAYAARFNTDGSWDTSFDGPAGSTGGDGQFTLPASGNTDRFNGVVVQPDGKLVFSGSTGTDMWVVRLNGSNGDYDISFNSTGKKTIDFGGTDSAFRVALDRDNKIVVGGTTSAGASGGDMAVARLLSSGVNAGTLDTSFNTSGTQTVSFTSGADAGGNVAVDDRNRIVLAGGGSGDLDVARFLPDGTLDAAFDGPSGIGNGKVSIDVSGTDSAKAVAIDGNGRILVAGSSGSNADFAVLRLNGTDGALDSTFNSTGKRAVDFGSSGEAAQTMLVQPDGRIVLAGFSNGDLAVARLGGGGTRLYAIQDANYNVTAVTDAVGKVMERYVYDPYGVYTVMNGDYTTDADGVQDIDQPFLFQGGRVETATGNFDFRNRFYRPTLGRWTGPDPSGYIDGLNVYQSVRSNPINSLDPLGLEAWYEAAWRQANNFAGGIIDNVSYGQHRRLRQWLSKNYGTVDTVDPNSGLYKTGDACTTAAQLYVGVGAAKEIGKQLVRQEAKTLTRAELVQMARQNTGASLNAYAQEARAVGSSYRNAAGNASIAVKMPGAGNTSMDAIYEVATGELRISNYAVDEAYQGSLRSVELFKSVIAEAKKFGGIKKVYCTPALSNLEALKDAKGAIEASRAGSTPWAKALKELGFETKFDSRYGELHSTPSAATGG